jgi:hypothetical protein
MVSKLEDRIEAWDWSDVLQLESGLLAARDASKAVD